MTSAMDKRSPHGVAFALVSLALAACGDSNPLGSTTGLAEPQAEDNFAEACDWFRVFDGDKVNVAFPDTSANYWLAYAPALPLPGLRVRIDGRYPDARYFSFNAYNAKTAPTDAIGDFEIAPEIPGTNPFLSETRRDPTIAAGAPYIAYLEYGLPPEPRPPNTFYSGNVLTLASLGIPNAAGAIIIYRTYVPRFGFGLDGGVGLPKLTLETPGGDVPFANGTDCTKFMQTLIQQLPSLTDAINNVDYPDGTPGPPFFIADDPPAFKVFYGIGLNLLRDNGAPIPPTPVEDSDTGGFFSNVHNRYAYGAFARNLGGLYLARGRAPSFTDSVDAEPGALPQVRYWSICQNELGTQRVTDCVADWQATLDDEGFYNVVVSDPADRPANADFDHGFDWLPWGGGYYDGYLILRNMLPEPGFAEAIQNVPHGTDPVSVMTDYFPVATYCTRETFEANAEATPREVFEACATEQNPSSF
jgi:hypothetical protein